MTIDEVQEQRKKLERDIEAAIMQFEMSTRTHVVGLARDVQYVAVSAAGEERSGHRVRIEVAL